MSLNNAVKNIKGFVSIKIEGYFVERFLNLIMNNKIEIWDIEQENIGMVTAKIYAKDFSKLKNIVKKSKCKIKIESKKGVPFVLNKYRHRKIFAVLIAVISTIITILNLYIWKVEITGQFTFPIEEIKQTLQEENIKAGVLKRDIDVEKIKLNILLKRDDIAWMGIAIRGNRAVVEIIEKAEKGNDYVNKEPGNIIADKEGVVEKIYVAEGVAKVKKGDTIEKGQLLISGEVTSEFSDTRFVAADGEIVLKTWYTVKYSVPYEKDIVSKTGNIQKDYKLNLFNCEINLLNNGTNFEKYDTIVSCNKFSMFGKIYFPIEVTTQLYEEVSIEKVLYTKEQARQMAINLAKQSAISKLPKDAKIIDEKMIVTEKQEGIEAEVLIVCEEKTGVYKRIGGYD